MQAHRQHIESARQNVAAVEVSAQLAQRLSWNDARREYKLYLHSTLMDIHNGRAEARRDAWEQVCVCVWEWCNGCRCAQRRVGILRAARATCRTFCIYGLAAVCTHTHHPHSPILLLIRYIHPGEHTVSNDHHGRDLHARRRFRRARRGGQSGVGVRGVAHLRSGCARDQRRCAFRCPACDPEPRDHDAHCLVCDCVRHCACCLLCCCCCCCHPRSLSCPPSLLPPSPSTTGACCCTDTRST